ncbi:MAG TPA: hypothetical protein PLR06_10580 [Cyclobacteriaceae bacterium]|nr:hypothetical protein [Cyclobacteriaceae bacterium]
MASLNSVYGIASDETGWFRTGINVRAGYFLADNVAIGLTYGHKNLSKVTGEASCIGAFARYYTSNHLFFGAGFNYYTAAYSYPYYTPYPNPYPYLSQSSSSGNLTLELGAFVIIGKHFSLEPALSVVLGHLAEYSDSPFRINLGLSYYFNRKLHKP